jgi:hypothetical protein
MYYNDHHPPHFHARYAEHEGLFAIATLEILDGTLPRRPHAFVVEWASLHMEELPYQLGASPRRPAAACH